MSVHQPAKKILLDSTHFHDIRSTISSRPVAWDALVRAADLSEFDASIAKKLDSVLLKHGGSKCLDVPIENCVLALVHLLSTSSNQDARKSVINLLSELLTHDRFVHEVVRYFQKNQEAVETLFNGTLAEETVDTQFILISSFNVVSLLVQNGLQNDNLVQKLLSNDNYISVLSNLDEMDTSYICIRLLQELLTVKQYRKLIWMYEKAFLPVMFQILERALEAKSPTRAIAANSNNLGIQSQYYALLIIWLLTFEPTIASELANKYLVKFLMLLKLVKITIKEKITRLSIAIILNCVAPDVKGRKETIKNLLLLGSGLPILQQLGERKYSDEELREDLTQLQGILTSEYQELTSFDEYVAELDSKLLIWSPPHVDNTFWSENSHRFKDENWKLFRQLLEVLEDYSSSQDSKDNVAVQVALNDITHIVELQPECVNVLGKLNAKVIIMELLNHSDSKVKYEALKTTQAFVANTFK
ncbi:H(+)-transporting V1 sector ATPase subunit H Ecym_4662 [Eremothecium cymbalariae DBVPG|uniref:V-type proton ATPase subunit H n=1 Tax=Eremothecium cymbalariae (strain CBS 270.75 / DBVPG 7215 / KCTC 17166 / NRRL Y-17582) TaxID=931890 RepID=G8JSG1_ERECY|nr:hypothetical protein Ecym_4662 [Eremothecium cymbalariae DBVPG\